MPIYEITKDRLQPVAETTFDALKLRERGDLQRLLRSQIETISPETLVISEEFCDWEDSRRRIDLLGIDKSANLVVFELKRTEDGGHMELQAVRYAAMVATMTFEKAVEVYSNHLATTGVELDPRASLLQFLGWDEADEDRFAQDVRIVLVSAEFSKELTTAVMWLNERDLDIRCVRIKPYSHDGKTLVDVQQVVPLPEAADYQVRLREKEVRERTSRREQTDLEKQLVRFWAELLQRAKLRTPLHSRISPGDATWIAAGCGVSGLSLVYAFGRNSPRVELYIDTGDVSSNKRYFDALLAQKARIEADFGQPLGWERLDDKRASRIRFDLAPGSVRNESTWPTCRIN